MKRVAIFSSINPEIWQRQEFLYKLFSGSLNNQYFYFGTRSKVEQYFDLKVYYGQDPWKIVPKSNSVRFVTEPPEIVKAKRRKWKKYDEIFIPYDSNLPNLTKTQTCLPWRLGIDFSANHGIVNLDSNQIKNIATPTENKISIVVSNKILTEDQKQRQVVAHFLAEKLGDQINLKGRGYSVFKDKSEVLAKSDIHVAMENSSHENYWTEKLADPILARNFVFYYGAKTLPAKFHNVQSFNIYDPLPKILEELLLFVETVRNQLDSKRESILDLAVRSLILDESLHAVLEKYA